MINASPNPGDVSLTAEEEALALSLLAQLRDRNARETQPFKGIHQCYQLLLRENNDLRKRSIESDNQLIILRNKLSEGLSSSEANSAIRFMQDELGRLREAAEKAGQAEYISEQLRLIKRIQELEENLKQTESTLHKIQIEHGESMANNSKLEAVLQERLEDIEKLKEELKAVRGLLSKVEGENEQLKAENQVMVAKVLEDKLRMLEDINAMNDELKVLRANRKLSTRQNSQSSESIRLSLNDSVDGFMVDIQKDFSDDYGIVPSRCRNSFQAHNSPVNDITYNEHGTWISSAGNDGTVKVWDASSGICRASLVASGTTLGSVSMIHVSMYGDMVAAGCSDNSARIWSHSSSRQLAHLTGHRQKVSSIVWLGNGKHLATASHDCSIKVWNLERQWNSSPALMRSTSKCNAMDIDSSSNASLITGHYDGSVCFWDTRTSSRTHKVESSHSGQITSVHCVGSYVLTASRENALKLIDLRMFETVKKLQHDNYKASASISRVSLSPGASYAAAGSADKVVYVWDVNSGHVSAQLESHAAPVVACHWSPGRSSNLASCDLSGYSCLWS